MEKRISIGLLLFLLLFLYLLPIPNRFTAENIALTEALVMLELTPTP